jgi:putative endonuclease
VENERGRRARPSGKNARQGLGQTGERLAADKLALCGYRILERNFRCRLGEIDIVAEHEQDLVFVEVKTRRGIAYGLPEEAVTTRKFHTITRVAAYYMQHKLERPVGAERAWRIDVVAVQLSPGGRLEEIRIYQHACIE